MKTNFITIFLVCLGFLMLESCTIVGFTSGLVYENKYDRGEPLEISGNEFVNLDGEDSITVYLKNGTSIKGLYTGKGKLSPELYNRKYRQFKHTSTLNIYLPAVGDTLIIKTVGKRRLKKIFAGYDLQGLLLKEKHNRKPELLLYISIVSFSGQSGKSLSGEVVAEHIKNGDIPVYTAILLESAGAKRKIQISQISSIELPVRNSNAMGWGTLIGLGADAVFVGLWALTFELEMNNGF